VFGIQESNLRYKVGRCGGGPGEFRKLGALYFTGDSLWILDVALNYVTVIGPDGGILARLPAEEVFGDLSVRWGPSPVLGDDWYVGVRTRAPRDSLVIARVRKDEPLSTVSFLRQGAAVRNNNSVINLGAKICAATWGGAPTVVVAGMYRFEAVALTSEGVPIWHSTTPLEFLEPAEYQSQLVPSAYVLSPICGPEGVMLRITSTPPYAPPKARLNSGYFEIRRPDGGIVLSGMTPEEDNTLLQAGASIGANWLFPDAVSALPRIRVYSLVRE
jgi:hypothetical protein